jgi:hypothetical protein
MTGAEDLHGTFVKREQNAIVAHTEPEGVGHIPLERFHAPRACAREVQDTLEKPLARGTI